MGTKTIQIIVATHKKCWVPKDPIYLPLQVGREGKEDIGYVGDNTGDNISAKNDTWFELTGLYWGWKNLQCEYIGLVQYRRYFMYKKKGNLLDSILTTNQAEMLLDRSDIILPQKRRYFFMTLEEHFNGYDFTIDSDMDNFREAVRTVSPDYEKAFNSVMKRKSGHMCNMFIMRRELLNAFCEWEFSVLGELERRTGGKRKRLLGYAAEHMVDIWIEKNGFSYVECGVAFLDKKNEFNKRFDFIMRLTGMKYRRIPL